jgi:hypothetical protein
MPIKPISVFGYNSRIFLMNYMSKTKIFEAMFIWRIEKYFGRKLRLKMFINEKIRRQKEKHLKQWRVE